MQDSPALLDLLSRYGAAYPEEQTVVARFRSLLAQHPRCFERDCWAGHITGSAWVVNPAHTHVLLTHHRKLNKWLQVGGHSDGDSDTRQVAMREAEEESGLVVSQLPLVPDIFDIDVHVIPARKNDPDHHHYDVRFALVVEGSDQFTVSAESIDLAWVEITSLAEYTDESSMLRMQRKWRDLPI